MYHASTYSIHEIDNAQITSHFIRVSALIFKIIIPKTTHTHTHKIREQKKILSN